MTLDLLADVGGTNTRVGLARDRVLQAGSVTRMPNAAHPSLAALLGSYLDGLPSGTTVTRLAVAIAGPVEATAAGQSASMTNLDWRIDAQDLARDLSLSKVLLLNDLQAQALSLPHLGAGAITPVLDPVQAGPPSDDARLVVGLGTGFNAAMLHGVTAERSAFSPASEAGHTNMVVTTDEDLALATQLTRTTGFASVEDVLSGRGLVTLHDWLSSRAGASKSGGLDAAEVVAALAQGDPVARDVARIFTRQLGAVLGNLALIHLPRGGLVLVGGVARATAPHLTDHGLEQAFRSKGRFTDFMGQFGIGLLTDDFAALTGCAVALTPPGVSTAN